MWQTLTPQLFAMRWKQQLGGTKLPRDFQDLSVSRQDLLHLGTIRFFILGGKKLKNNRALSPAQWVS